jgi:hypothetical protein
MDGAILAEETEGCLAFDRHAQEKGNKSVPINVLEFIFK